MDWYHLCLNYNTSYIVCNPGDLWTFKNCNCKEYAFFPLFNLFFDINVSFTWIVLFFLGDSLTELSYLFCWNKVLLWLLCPLTQINNAWLKNTELFWSKCGCFILSNPPKSCVSTVRIQQTQTTTKLAKCEESTNHHSMTVIEARFEVWREDFRPKD